MFEIGLQLSPAIWCSRRNTCKVFNGMCIPFSTNRWLKSLKDFSLFPIFIATIPKIFECIANLAIYLISGLFKEPDSLWKFEYIYLKQNIGGLWTRFPVLFCTVTKRYHCHCNNLHESKIRIRSFLEETCTKRFGVI